MIHILGSEACIFFTVMVFTLIYFGLIDHLTTLKMTAKELGVRIFFSLINSFIVTSIESFAGGKSNLAVISLITFVLILERIIMKRKKDYSHFYFHSYWLTSMQLQSCYLFSCALVNLFISHTWKIGSPPHRYGIFSTTMIVGIFIFSLQLFSPKSFIISLGNILMEKSNKYLIIIYTMSATTVLAVSGSLISKLLYNDISRDIKLIMYSDILLKNFLILGGNLLIIVYLVLHETTHRANLELNEELETEKEFREKFHSDALLSYCANLTKNCFVKEKSEFLFPDESGYVESIMDFIMETVHPEDMNILSGLVSPEYFENRLKENPRYSLKIRLAPKPILALAGTRLTKEIKEQLKKEHEWIWVEFHITVIREPRTNDILTYVSLNNIDTEMTEKEKLVHDATTDSLTGLLNRNGFEEAVKKHLLTSSSGGTLFMIDMDYFKSVNDHLGHPMGDQALKDTSEILRSIFLENDLICRMGGDEFCVFLKNMDNREIIIQRAETLMNAGRRTYSSVETNENVSVSFSIGIHTYSEGSNIFYEELYKHADEALYHAKEAGRNTYYIYEAL